MPSSLLTVSRATPVAMFVTITETPGIAAPDPSLIRP
jgi:hypothetical protein